jgi:hypothetical protein
MPYDPHDIAYKLKHKIFNMRFDNTIRRRQRHAIGYLEPIIRRVIHPNYGLLPEKQVDLSQVKKALSGVIDTNVFTLIPVNTVGLRSSPDWASHSVLHSTIGHQAFKLPNAPMYEKIEELHGQLSTNQRKELGEMRDIIAMTVLPELARKLSNDIGGFTWRTDNNRPKDGPLTLLKLSLLPTMYYYFTAVKANDFDTADKALAMLNWMRFCLPIGDKAVSPGSWFLLTT